MKNKIKHLRYHYSIATRECGEYRHAQEVMKELGITYQIATPQTMGDQFWFWNCENIPEELPAYLTHLDLDPVKVVGRGLSLDEAKQIIEYEN